MRWRIPIVVVLALLVAANCDQQPVEPVDEGPAAETALFEGIYAGVYEIEGTRTVDLCGTEVTVEYWARLISRFDDGDGESMSHYFTNFTTHGWAESAGGDTWRLNESSNEQNQWIFQSAPDTWSIHWQQHWIGLGHAPDFHMNSFFHWTLNANGDTVTHWDFEDPLCPTS